VFRKVSRWMRNAPQFTFVGRLRSSFGDLVRLESIRRRAVPNWEILHYGKLVFAQLTEYLPLRTFRGGEHKTKRFTCLEQFLHLAFPQLTYWESLRDIEACFRA
jgi:hypothetical protein